jgi:hypothetical protein
MVVNHVLRHDFSEEERRIIGAYHGVQRPANRKEIKWLLTTLGEYGNANWDPILEEGRARLVRWRGAPSE